MSMKRTALLALTLAYGLCSFAPSDGGGLEYLLTGGDRMRWLVAGSPSAPEGECALHGHYFTFVREGSQVIEDLCVAGAPVQRMFTYSIMRGKQGEEISFNEVSYSGRPLSSAAPVCEGSGQCIRLSTLSYGKMDRSMDIYLIQPAP